MWAGLDPGRAAGQVGAGHVSAPGIELGSCLLPAPGCRTLESKEAFRSQPFLCLLLTGIKEQEGKGGEAAGSVLKEEHQKRPALELKPPQQQSSMSFSSVDEHRGSTMKFLLQDMSQPNSFKLKCQERRFLEQINKRNM